MTLNEWCKKADVKATHPTTEKGAVSVIADGVASDLFPVLWHLEDFKVSSVRGVVVWLMPV